MSMDTNLSGDTAAIPKADGVSTHTATLAVSNSRGSPQAQAQFTLSGAGQFKPRSGQTVSPDGTTLTATIRPNAPVQVYFADNNSDGETIVLSASTTTDGKNYTPSSPASLNFQFASTNTALKTGGTVELTSLYITLVAAFVA
jgi:hypothetical protein